MDCTHTMSLKPSPLKSPVPWMNQQLGSAEPGDPLVGRIVVPCMCQTTTCPLVLCQRMSLKPSPLKSPVPAIVQEDGGARLGEPLLGRISARSINHKMVCPLVGLYQRISLTPSPLKSPVPAIVQGVGGDKESVSGAGVSVLSMNQIETARVAVLNHRMSPNPLPSKSPVPTTAKSVVFVPRKRLAGNGSTFGPLRAQRT